jgi:hypothetical protein
MTRLLQLERRIARLERRAEALNQISRKYWNARRIIFICGVLLALAFCNFAGRTTAWFVAAILVVLFSIVTVFHNKVRDSLTRNSLLMEIKKVQMHELTSTGSEFLQQTQRQPQSRATRLKQISTSPGTDRFIDCSTALSREKAVKD